ncbi:MAG TPA: hypothetical protein VFA59_19045 [Vicinamibacterales bacterium]|nr:hypothetical protein [Vicinamibacterales bacterium]
MHAVLLPVHIVAGGIAIVLGAIALIVAKGGTLHRTSGILFVYAMLAMGISASILAFIKGGVTDPNFLGGFTCAYFVVTALTTVRARSALSRRVDAAAATVAFSLAALEVYATIQAWNRPHFSLNGVPGPMIVFLGSIFAIGGIGDVRVLRSGSLAGSARLKRHLWRMCFALFIAAGSFFSIRARVAKILPEPFLSGPMRALPVLLIFVAMFYWMWRLSARRRPSVILRSEPAPAAVRA